MAQEQLRLEQYETVLYNANLNPLGVPKSVKTTLMNSIDSIGHYPGDYKELKKVIATYANCKADQVVLGTGSSDLLRLYIALLAPKKAMVIVPTSSEYEHVLSIYGCKIKEYTLDEKKDFAFDVDDYISKLDKQVDLAIIGNPNNPTSQIVTREDMTKIATACKEKGIFLIIDEMYIEFTDDYKQLTAVPLVEEFDNIAILRSISKFFAMPGLRFAYAIMNNEEQMSIIDITTTPNNISTLTIAACKAMFTDSEYISMSRSQVHTERNLIYSAMSTDKNVHIVKPYGSFAIVKLLNPNVNASKMAEICNTRGLVIRNCSDIKGLDDSYIRFCFMNPKQNDLLVNTILESAK